ncbi:peptidoglycan editing factor PgeF [Halobacillus sp. Marseille-P3879]|uniref:peptidoglycan editing factor PgeF n=1 Tax=Halobacillus sp. Marseille-P3879 TaxID=2045014 RepID=UPI000C7B783E|nr:peptidoglycan editing factor PgeF [Halobacillus sp. Marseille-P3879]
MTEPFQYKTLKQLSCFSDYQVTAGITTRKDGYSEVPFKSLNMGLHVSDESDVVITNRKSLAEELNVPLENWVMGEQVHGTNIRTVTKAEAGRGAYVHGEAINGVDGLITNEKGILLTAFYADCVPLLFIEPESGWIGIAHAGWKGTVNEIARCMAERLAQQGASLSRINLAIGPCISKMNYEVDDHVIKQISTEFQDQVIEKVSENKFKLDLKELNRQIAVKAGISQENIQLSEYCTFNNSDLFFSHRRDQGQTGRMLAYIGLI